LGIDAGLAATGYGVVDVIGKQTLVRTYGVLRTTPRMQLPQRLAQLFTELQNLVEKERPDEIAVEEGFLGRNVKTALIMGQTRGVALLTAALANIEVFLYPPREVKLSLTGNGAASKDQVAFMVRSLLRLGNVSLSEDSSDALAVALCRCQRRMFEAKYRGSQHRG
jgi:crossover junction endodeoxyribonuclease RuvC